MANAPTSAEIQTLFNRIAPMYDQLNQWISLGQHQIWKTMTVKWCEPSVGDRALDLCCGSGDLTTLLAKKIGKTGEVIGLDFAPQQLAIAESKRQQNYPQLKIKWVEGDALNLPFQDHYFDCVTMGYGLRNVTDIPQSLREIHRVLKTGAKAAILDFHRPSETHLQIFQKWYFEAVVVPVAQMFNLTEEYAYLHPSIERFPTGAEQVKMAQDVGFTKFTHYPITGGMMGVLVVEK
jgi:demethylphylloquinol methyltransferase